MTKAGLLAGNRPMGNAQAVNDLRRREGPGHPRAPATPTTSSPGPTGMGRLASMNRANTCQDWTAASGTGTIQFGHSWPAGSGRTGSPCTRPATAPPG